VAITTWCLPTATCPRTRPFCGTGISLTLDGRTVLARSAESAKFATGAGSADRPGASVRELALAVISASYAINACASFRRQTRQRLREDRIPVRAARFHAARQGWTMIFEHELVARSLPNTARRTAPGVRTHRGSCRPRTAPFPRNWALARSSNRCSTPRAGARRRARFFQTSHPPMRAGRGRARIASRRDILDPALAGTDSMFWACPLVRTLREAPPVWTSSGRLRRFRRSACKALGGRLVPRARQGRERRIRHDVACDGQRHCRRGLKLSSADAALVHGHILPQIELIESQDIFVSPVAATSRFYVRHTRHHHRRGGSCSITPGARGGPLPRGSLARRYGAHHVGASGKDRALQADPEQRVQGPGDRFRHFRGHGAGHVDLCEAVNTGLFSGASGTPESVTPTSFRHGPRTSRSRRSSLSRRRCASLIARTNPLR